MCGNYKGLTFCFLKKGRSFLLKKMHGNYKRITQFFLTRACRLLLMEKECNYCVITFLRKIKKSVCCKKCLCEIEKRNNKVLTFIRCSIYFVITFFSFVSLTAFANDLIELKKIISQGSFVYGRTMPGVDVYYGDIKLIKNEDNQFVFALPQDTEDKLVLTAIKDNERHVLTSPIQKRMWKEEVVNGLPPQKVLPSPDDQKRIDAENKLLRAGRAKTHHEKMPKCFVRPISARARISSEFGSRRILNGVKTAGHSGTDYAMPTGTPLYAPADGIVKVTHPDMFYSGKTVLIDHGYGIFSSYSHMSDIAVREGDAVVMGQQIGKVGTTGRSTGPHLHFTMTWYGVRVDPEFVLTHFGCDE